MTTRSSQTPRRAILFFVMALLASLIGVQGADAQDELGDFFGRIFGGESSSHSWGRSRSRAERHRRIAPPRRETHAPTYNRGRYRERDYGVHERGGAPVHENAGAPAQENAAQKVQAYFYVAAVGDTLAVQLANGLDEAFEDKPEISIVHKGKENSGLVREDFYDWPKTAREIAAGTAPRIDLAVIMLGANDHQSMADGGEMREPFSDRWRELYIQRVDAMTQAFKEKGVPVVWVGLPVMKHERFSADMARLNEIFHDRAAKNGIGYIDVWEAFGDERGHFQAFGPDINGETVKIRAADGVHFTDAGARNLALFVEKEIKRQFDLRYPPGSTPAVPSPAAPEASTPAAPSASTLAPAAPVAAPAAPIVFPSPVAPITTAAPALPERPAIGPVQPLAPTAVDAKELARRGARPAPPAEPQAAAARALADHVFVEGKDQPAKPNRADDFSWRAGTTTPQ